MTDAPAHFDPQAESFDRRAGLPAGVARDVANSIAEIAEAEAEEVRSDGMRTLLEVGAGTGEIGIELLRPAALAPVSVAYVGFDLSRRMVALFRDRLAAGDVASTRGAVLAVADGSAAWPVRAGSVDLIFGSRSLHLLDPEHVVDECSRIAGASGALLLLGRVERDEDSVREVMRREMHSRLRELGLRARSGGRHRDALLRAAEARGGSRLNPVTAAEWTVEITPRTALESWKRTGGLGGRSPSAEDKEAILAGLARFAEREYDGLDTVVRSNERYRIEGARIAPMRAEGRS